MSPTGNDVVRLALATLRIQGVHYGSFDCADRCHPNLYPHCMDCSGFTSFVLNGLGLGVGCEGSFEQAREAHAAGHGLSTSEALLTPGCFLFQGINEGQGGTPGVDPGHVGISAGDGIHTLEARGHEAGVGSFIGTSLLWDWCGMPAGVTRTSSPPVPPSTVPPLSTSSKEYPMTMVALPRSSATLAGRVATARPIPAFNFVLLEDGGRLHGDVPVDPHDNQRHWWAPPADVHVPGMQLIDITDGRDAGIQAVIARYAFPNGSTGTYQGDFIHV